MKRRDAPPAAEDALLRRARAIAGATVGELAEQLNLPAPASALRGKGWAGEVVERALGGSAGNRDQPDFPDLGVELKTVPLDARGHVRESTYICYLDLGCVEREEWGTSRARRKLARVLWLPVEWLPGAPPASRRVGQALLWSPTQEQEAILRADWNAIIGCISIGGIDEVTAHMGQALQVRPKAPTSAARVEVFGRDGELLRTVPRGFYLRARFTEQILWDAQRTPTTARSASPP